MNRIRFIFMYSLYYLKELFIWLYLKGMYLYNILLRRKAKKQEYDNIMEVYKYIKEAEKKNKE